MERRGNENCVCEQQDCGSQRSPLAFYDLLLGLCLTSLVALLLASSCSRGNKSVCLFLCWGKLRFDYYLHLFWP